MTAPSRPAPTLEVLKRRAVVTELRTRIAQTARLYPDTHAALVAVMLLEHPATLTKALDALETTIRAAFTRPATPPPNPIAAAVAAVQSRRPTPAPTEPPTQETTMAKPPTITIHTELIPQAPDNPYPLGRAGVHHDSRNKNFRALIAPPPQTDRPGRAWATSVVFDQIDQNCTAEACVGLCKTYPHRLAFREDWPLYDDEAERVELYRAAQLVDPFPQTPPMDGSSTDAPFRILRDRGQIAEWRWLFGEAELWNYVTNYGPACVGTVWYRSMFEPVQGPAPTGLYLIVDPGTGVAGGHAWRIIQANAKRDAYRMVNSWGRAWGEHGRAWIKREAMAALLAADGEAVTLTEAAS